MASRTEAFFVYRISLLISVIYLVQAQQQPTTTSTFNIDTTITAFLPLPVPSSCSIRGRGIVAENLTAIYFDRIRCSESTSSWFGPVLFQLDGKGHYSHWTSGYYSCDSVMSCSATSDYTDWTCQGRIECGTEIDTSTEVYTRTGMTKSDGSPTTDVRTYTQGTLSTITSTLDVTTLKMQDHVREIAVRRVNGISDGYDDVD